MHIDATKATHKKRTHVACSCFALTFIIGFAFCVGFCLFFSHTVQHSTLYIIKYLMLWDVSRCKRNVARNRHGTLAETLIQIRSE